MQDFAITTDQGLGLMSMKGGDSRFNNVYLSLEVAKGTFFLDPDFGLQLRPRAKNNDNTARLIRADILSALQWLLDTKRAAAIAVVMSRDTLNNKNILAASVTVTWADNSVTNYQKFVEVV